MQWTLAGLGRIRLPTSSVELPPGAGVIWQSAHPVITGLAEGAAYWQWLRVDLRGCDALAVELITRGHMRFSLPLDDPVIPDLLSYHRSAPRTGENRACSLREAAVLAARLTSAICEHLELPDRAGDPLIEAVEGVIRREGLARHGVGHIAHRLGYSQDYLSRRFKQTTGVSLAAHIRQRVMVRALTLIQAGDMPIAKVARLLGYQSSAHFGHVFRSHHGVSPGDLRVQHRQICR